MSSHIRGLEQQFLKAGPTGPQLAEKMLQRFSKTFEQGLSQNSQRCCQCPQMDVFSCDLSQV